MTLCDLALIFESRRRARAPGFRYLRNGSDRVKCCPGKDRILRSMIGTSGRGSEREG